MLGMPGGVAKLRFWRRTNTAPDHDAAEEAIRGVEKQIESPESPRSPRHGQLFRSAGKGRHTAGVRRYAVASAALAPVALIGGWTLAAARQPPGYSSTRDTISSLAARSATDRWIMTAALAVLGACHLITASGLTEARVVARVLLALGGFATITVAALPQPSTGHVPAATLGFISLALWPALSSVPSRRTAQWATVLMVLLLGWLAAEIHDGRLLGLSERTVAGTQALWPLLVVVTLIVANRQRSERRKLPARTSRRFRG